MESKILISVVAIFCGFLVAESTQSEFSDVWTNELKESYSTCRGRLPPAVDAEGLKFAVSPRKWYVKYWDQITLFRFINLFVEGHTDRPLSELRCLFESPCLLVEFGAAPDGLINGTFSACTGGKVNIKAKLGSDGLLETALFYPNGTAAWSGIFMAALTDNKTFALYISCLPDGSYGFQVYTTRPALSAYTRHLIKDYLENSGFKDNFRISTSYLSTSCKKHTIEL